MPDRWDDENELERGRDRLRRPEPEPEPTVGELIEGSVRKLVTGIVIAGGLIGLGVYGGGRAGGGSAPGYQVTTSADGRMVYRVNTDSGSIVACRDSHCWLMQRGSSHLDDEPPAETPKQNASPAPPQAVTAQPAPPPLPAPQNSTAPAVR
jgi:hypothetical protein